MSTKPLPPCPVCGAEMRVYQYDYDRRKLWVRCDNDPACIYQNKIQDHRALCAIVAKGREAMEKEKQHG